LGLELSNATSSSYWIFVLLFDEAHNPKVVSSNLTPATNPYKCFISASRKPDALSGFRRYETGRVGLCSREFRKAWNSRAVGRQFPSEAQGKRSARAAAAYPAEQDT